MKALVKLYPLLIIIIFIASCYLSTKISVPLLKTWHTIAIDKSNYPKYSARVVVVDSDDIDEVFIENLDKYKDEHPNYSFLIPKEREEYFRNKINEKVNTRNRESSTQLRVEQIGENKQLIEYEMDGDKRSYLTKYEATEKEIVPLTFVLFDIILGCEFFFIGIMVGAICCGIFKFIFNKYIKSKAVEA
jgi:hypothetical protein